MLYIGNSGNINRIYEDNKLCAKDYKMLVKQYELIIACDDAVAASGRFAFLWATGIGEGELQIYEINFYDGKQFDY